MRRLIRCNGTTLDFDAPLSIEEIEKLLGTEVVDSRLIDETHVMIFDDTFIDKRLPLNSTATRIYHLAGFSIDQPILGDVYVCPDADFVKVGVIDD
ncbi:hypothetical protein [Burkholderia sp. LMG 21824]|uniref:hypothetical protein n=1 Tax=Burkholderia sp. LMG 21824 TaxID=3158172 RepID=UPI003C30C3FA